MQFEAKPLDPESLAIHDRALACAKRYLFEEVELLEAIMEVDRHLIHEQFAYSSLTQYCVQKLKLSDEVAGCFVRVARKCAEIPELKVALGLARLTLFKAKTIASVISEHNPEFWIKKAESLTKDALEREVAGNESKKIKLTLTREQFELLKRARDLLAQKLGYAVTWEETIHCVLELWLERNDPLRKAERNPTTSHEDRSQERSSTKPLKIPSNIRHAVNRRDQGRCQARLPDGAVCNTRTWVHFHHIVPRAQGGGDTVDNLITLCSAHHRQWHEAH